MTDNPDPRVTVAQLIAALRTYPQDAEVSTSDEFIDVVVILPQQETLTLIEWQGNGAQTLEQALTVEVTCKRHRPPLLKKFLGEADANAWIREHREEHLERDLAKIRRDRRKG